MKLFSINWPAFREMMLPVRLRKPRMLAWVEAQMKPVVSLFGRFRLQRDKNLYRVNHTPARAHMEGMLNDHFDAGMRRIRIVDAPADYEPIVLRRMVENLPVYFRRQGEGQPVYDFSTDEVQFLGFDFVVEIPESIDFDINRMQSLIAQYGKPGIAYKIEQV